MTRRKWNTHDFLDESQKLLERAPTSTDADLTPPMEELLKELCRQERSGKCAGQFARLPRPIYRPGYAVSNALRTSALKCAGAPSCWNHIRAFMLAETLCSRTASSSCRNITYVPLSRHLGGRYGLIK
ncbi:hypothetical protein TNCV_538821 [Trichonephila clavipes]|nr:hypothetical protein TNCV_538821 [Trichonephila clavipes]